MYDQFNKCLALEKDYIHVENGGSFYYEMQYGKLSIYLEWSNGKVDWINNFDFLPKCRIGFKRVWALIVAFFKAIIFNAHFPKQSYKDMENKWYCHRGFLKVWKSIEPYLKEIVMDEAVKEIEIIGYSHGGGLAQLCFEWVKFWRPDVKARGYGFGAPRIFWGNTSKTVKDRFKGFIVVRNGRDIVTHLPPRLFGFKDICAVLVIGESKGLIKDHYAERYREALKEFDEVVEVFNGIPN